MKADIFQEYLCICLILHTIIRVVLVKEIPDTFKTTPQLIRKHGYPVESHYVTTEDGYILQMHRIPYSPKFPPQQNRTVALLHHGNLLSSFDWVVLGPSKSLAYLLSDNGYDVWLANSRGNTYSRNHTTLNPNRKEFWKHGWHEIGIYDLPSEIDYILRHTGKSALQYIGHSMGTTVALVLLSEKPEYNSKLKSVQLLAPSAKLTRPVFMFRILTTFLRPLTQSKFKYSNLLDKFIFIAIAIESSGTWSTEGFNFIKEVGQRIGLVCGNARVTAFLLHRISIAVQQCNVSSVIGTLPLGKKLEELFLF